MNTNPSLRREVRHRATSKTFMSRSLLACAIGLFLAVTSYSVTFPGTNTGAIADGGSPNPTCGSSRDVTFDVTGIFGVITSVSVDLTISHTYIGDLQVFLIAPDSTAHPIFTYVGRNVLTSFGDSSNLNGTYSFSDAHTGNIWAAAAGGGTAFVVPPGNYRTQDPGPFSTIDPGPPFSSLDTAFSSVALPNGTWVLRFLDCAGIDTGTVSAANLTIGSLGPTSAGANISGRVAVLNGRSLSNVEVMLTGGNLEQPVRSRTNAFGFYMFENIPSGQTYILSVGSKSHFFPDPIRVINLDDELMGVDFFADPDPLLIERKAPNN